MPLILSGDTGPSIVSASAMFAGSVLQVVQGTTGALVQSSSSTPIDTGLTATITPTSTTSKILVLVSQNGTERSSSSSTNGINLFLLRNSTTLSQWALALGYTASGLTLITNGSVSYLDSPATTSATIYKTQFASYNNSGTVRVQSNAGDLSTITLLEIKG